MTRVTQDDELRAHAKTALDSAKAIYTKIQADGPRKAATNKAVTDEVMRAAAEIRATAEHLTGKTKRKSHKLRKLILGGTDRRRRRGGPEEGPAPRRGRVRLRVVGDGSEATREAAEAAIDVLLQEKREFLPSPEFVRTAVVSDASVYDQADRDLDGFWLERANEFLSWATPPTQGLEWDPPHCTWFADGTLNVSAQLPRPPRRGRSRRQGRLPLRPRAGRRGRPRDHLLRPARRRVPVRERAARARHRQGRRRRPLHGHGARAGRRDARLRPHRRAARRRLRRLLGRGARRAAGVDRRKARWSPRTRRGARAAACRSR